MTPAELQSWRSRMGWTAKAASQALGLSEKGYAAYERGYAFIPGRASGVERSIPKHVALACERLEEMADRPS